MITRITPPKQKESWQTLFSQVITDPEKLFQLLALDPIYLPAAYEASKHFPLRVPEAFVKRMKKGDIHDPLLRQLLPLDEELILTPGFSHDPLAEKNANPVSGLLHKYDGRVLLTLT